MSHAHAFHNATSVKNELEHAQHRTD